MAANRKVKICMGDIEAEYGYDTYHKFCSYIALWTLLFKLGIEITY